MADMALSRSARLDPWLIHINILAYNAVPLLHVAAAHP
jgi:hypothetical protein